MAKPRKPPKNESSKPDNSAQATVLHQKLCLDIDIDNRRIHGFTELEIASPDNGIIGLHAENLEIERVYVDGEPTEFDIFPHYQPVEIENRWCSVSSVSSAADAAGVTYISALERELVPNLLILCRRSIDRVNQHGQPAMENGGQSNGEVKQNVKSVRIDYWVEKAEAGIHFHDNVLHTNSQLRRAHCWFPCMDDTLQRCCYDLEFTVPHNFVAVSNGSLLYQVLSKDDPPRKTFVYKLDVPVSASWISLSVAPFQILPDYHSHLLSHMCLPENLPKLQNTVGFFHSAFRHYETYLKASFPFGSYKQVFIAPEMVLSSVTLGASMCVFSSQILYDEKVIDQTIDTRIKLAYALARQWFGVYITPETPNDEWLVDGLAGFLADTFIREFLGNNEARYRRYKANCAVLKADDSGATTLNPAGPSKDLYGTQSIGLYGRIRSWKSVAVLQMLEKQMGPELFKGILRSIVSRAQDATRFTRTLSTKEFRHFANKNGNLERPFLKEFFHRWVETCGCPVLRMGFTYSKRKNMADLAAFRECTAPPNANLPSNGAGGSEIREGENGWPGMMTIKVHEFDGTHDHLLPMAGDAWQLLEIKCHSRFAAKRFQKPKKGSKPDGSDDNGDVLTTVDMRTGTESPLLWVRADPEMEYLAEIHVNQPLYMWINQLEKDKDVVAQVEAITTFEELPSIPFPVINALTNLVGDAKAFWRVRIEAAFALAKTASEDTDLTGMHNLLKLYRTKRFDPSIGLPKPNDFHDFPEYFVLEALPHAVATVRTVDNGSPAEAVEFILQILKYNDNSGNPYSDIFWLAALVEAVGELEFSQQTVLYLSSFLKRIDRLLQFDRLMLNYNGILTISCIRTLTQMSLKLSEFIPLDRIYELIKSFQDFKALWQVRIEASRALLDLEFHFKGIDAALVLFIKFLEQEPSLRGQAKLGVHMIRLSQISAGSGSSDDVKSQTLVTLLRLLESRVAFCNVLLRHHLFCIIQVLAGRRPTLYVVPRDHMPKTGYAEICSEQRNNFLAFINQIKPPEPLEFHSPSHNELMVQNGFRDIDTVTHQDQRIVVHDPPPDHNMPVNDPLSEHHMPAIDPPPEHHVPASDPPPEHHVLASDPPPEHHVPVSDPLPEHHVPVSDPLPEHHMTAINPPPEHHTPANDPPPEHHVVVSDPPPEHHMPVYDPSPDKSLPVNDPPRDQNMPVNIPAPDQSIAVNDPPFGQDDQHVHANNPPLVLEPRKDGDAVSSGQGRKLPVVKIKVKAARSSKGGEGDYTVHDRSQVGPIENDVGPSSSVSVDAPQRNLTEAVSISNQIMEEVNSCQVTASIGSAKITREGDELGKEFQCTADSSSIPVLQPPYDQSAPINITDEVGKKDVENHGEASRAPAMVGPPEDADGTSLSVVDSEKHKKKKKDKEKKRKRDDPEYLERKRLKKEKKQREKEMAKLVEVERKSVLGDHENSSRLLNDSERPENMAMPSSSSGPKIVLKTSENKSGVAEGGSSTGHKLRIKIKNRTIGKI